jgi:hypothetical protein
MPSSSGSGLVVRDRKRILASRVRAGHNPNPVFIIVIGPGPGRGCLDAFFTMGGAADNDCLSSYGAL